MVEGMRSKTKEKKTKSVSNGLGWWLTLLLRNLVDPRSSRRSVLEYEETA